MDCTISDEKLWSWVDRDAPELDEHLAECARCRGVVEQLRRDLGRVAAVNAPPSRKLPDSIASYRPTRLIGEGGQGLVYEAEQQTPRRRVALKVLKAAGFAHSRDRRLFEREVESLGRLRHPNIAAIHEAGSTPDGHHFFAMDFIDGTPLNSFVRRRELAIRDRLRLFHRICEPVTYAHQRGVIHRDLKPSNVLVDETGNPHVLDFGLARTTDSDITLTCTADDVGKVLGTLPYMSPEQAAGNSGEIDVRSDVYALGVMLYELLTGRLPHAVSRTVPHEALRAIREDPPPRPSSIKPALRGDLETIILKALEKEPARRYQSVAALADDVQRYLDGEAILGRRPSASYQLRKLVARHKGPFAFAAVLLLVITSFAVVATIQAARERAARATAVKETKRARLAAARAQRIREFLEELFLAADPRWTSGEMTVRELLEEAQRRVDAEYADDPGLEGDLRTILGEAYLRFGFSMKALEQFERALQLRESLYGESHTAVAEACHNLAQLLVSRERAAEGELLYERALQTRRTLFGAEHPDTLATMSALAGLHLYTERTTEAEELATAVLAARRRTADAEPNALAEALDRYSSVLAAQGHFAEAEAAGRESLSLRQQHFGPEDKLVADSFHRLAMLCNRPETRESAEAHYVTALALYERLPNQLPNVLLMKLEFGQLKQDQDELDAALELFVEALAAAKQAFPEWHYIVLWCHKEYGECLVQAGHPEQAGPHLRRALTGYRELSGDDHIVTRGLRDALADLETQLTDTAGASDG